ncbi:calponin homology domain-containing protein, partial [Dichotomocladium elegans]
RNLGSDYEEVQKRTLTSWTNAKLSTIGDQISNIETDLKDGKRLLKLLSVVSGQPAPKPERMNMRIHQLANVAQALEFLQKLVRPDILPDIGNEAIVNGD